MKDGPGDSVELVYVFFPLKQRVRVPIFTATMHGRMYYFQFLVHLS